MSLPGSSQMGVLKKLMLKIPWYAMSPAQDLLADFRSQEKLVLVASSAMQAIIYIPHRTQWIKLKKFPQSELAQYFWINPVSGDSSVTRQITGTLFFTPPDTSDWILVIQKSAEAGLAKAMRAPAHLLEQNYPNPFNPRTTIRYHVVEDACVAVKVYTLLGSEVATLVNDEHTAGSYSVEFDASLLPSGVYFYRISSPWFSETKKFVLLK